MTSPTPQYILQRIEQNRQRQDKVLDLSGRLGYEKQKLLTIPPEVFSLTHLEELHLHYQGIQTLPVQLNTLPHLKIIDVRGNPLREIADLSGLVLDWGTYKRLKLRPEQIAGLWLRWIEDDLIEELLRLPNLHWLDLSFNRLTEIPKTIFQLHNLTVLDLSSNELSQLPDSLSQLHNLTALYLSDNQLSKLPKKLIFQLDNLRKLYLENNPIQNPPIEVLGLDDYGQVNLTALHRYFRQQKEQGIDILYEAKFLIIGKGGAGKTSLARRIQNPEALLPKDNESTHGIDVMVWSFTLADGNTFRVNIWDFGGQAIYHATHQFFLTKSALYALVVDTRRDDSEQLDLELYWWLSAVELLSDNSPVFIIKNEKDDRFFQINEPALRERFSNLLNQVHSSNFATNRGRENILDTLKYQISHLPHVGKPLPKTWVKVRRALENDLRNYIPIATYLKLCQQHGFKNHQDALHLSQTLHNLGVCLHFQDNDLLAKTVFLKPEWGTAAVYQILDNDKIKRDFGHFDRADLHTIWHDEQYAGIHGELLELMKKFELCYELPEKNHYIAPQLLENQRPANYHWDNHDNLQLRYTYPQFMPKGILSRFIVNIHESIAEQRRCVWLTGVVLEKDHTWAEVTENYPLKTIQIRVAGRHKRDLITIIVHELDKIHNSYHDRLKFHRLIPCQCEIFKDDPEFFEYEKLRNFAEQRREIQCQKRNCYNMLNAQALIDGVYKIPPELKPEPPLTNRVIYVKGDYYEHNTEDNMPTKPKKNAAWVNGSFYLIVAVVIMTMLAIMVNYVHPFMLPVIVIGGLLAIGIVGALQLRNDGELTQKNFLTLMLETYKRLPLLRGNESKKK